MIDTISRIFSARAPSIPYKRIGYVQSTYIENECNNSKAKNEVGYSLMAWDQQESSGYHSHQRPTYIPTQLIGFQELYNWKPPIQIWKTIISVLRSLTETLFQNRKSHTYIVLINLKLWRLGMFQADSKCTNRVVMRTTLAFDKNHISSKW